MDIDITEDKWKSMLDDMTNLYGDFGVGGGTSGGDFADEDLMKPSFLMLMCF